MIVSILGSLIVLGLASMFGDSTDKPPTRRTTPADWNDINRWYRQNFPNS